MSRKGRFAVKLVGHTQVLVGRHNKTLSRTLVCWAWVCLPATEPPISVQSRGLVRAQDFAEVSGYGGGSRKEQHRALCRARALSQRVNSDLRRVPSLDRFDFGAVHLPPAVAVKRGHG